jgi:SAM-dependent methyltransferase
VVKYEPETFWSDVARHIAERPDGNVVAGDATPYYRYKRARFVARFLDALPVRDLNVLEVGCGPGGNLRVLARSKPARLVGADI